MKLTLLSAKRDNVSEHKKVDKMFARMTDGKIVLQDEVTLLYISIHPSSIAYTGRVTEAVSAGGSRLPFPWPHWPVLTGGAGPEVLPGQCRDMISVHGSGPFPMASSTVYSSRIPVCLEFVVTAEHIFLAHL